MIRLSLNNLLRNKSRTLLTTIGITIGVAVIISLVSISAGVGSEADNALGNMQYIILMQKGALDDTLSHVSLDVAERIGRFRGVGAYTTSISFFPSTFNGKSTSSDASSFVQVIGIEPEDAEKFKDTIWWYKADRGSMIAPGDDNSILVSGEFAEDNNLFVGSVVELDGEKFRISGVFNLGTSIGSSFAGLIVMNIDKARKLSGYGSDEVGYVNVLPEDLSESEHLIKRLENSFPQLRIYTSQDATEMLASFLGSLTIALWFVSSIAAVVGGIGVMNTMLMSVMERIKEFGVLKAVGWRNRDIAFMVLGESLLIGFSGGLFGVGLGFAGSFAVSVFSGIPTLVTLPLIFEVVLFAVLIGVVSALYPAFVASSMSPVEAVSYE